MPVKVIVEFQAKPGQRDELKGVLKGIAAEHGPTAPGFIASNVYAVLDDPDGLVEIVDWETREAQTAAVEEAMATGIYAPVFELVAEPFKATMVSESF